MTKEELENLQKLAQQCCDNWIQILNLQQWVVTVIVTDDAADLNKEDNSLSCKMDIGAATILLPTGDVWSQEFRNYPYNMEVYIVSRLLSLMRLTTNGDIVNYSLARSLFSLKSRCDELIHYIEDMNKAKQAPAEPEVIEPEPVDEEESDN